MKYLKVKIARSNIPGGGTHYEYPPEYEATQVKFGPTYETSNPANVNAVKARPSKHEECFIAVDDADAVGFLASADITEITEAQFISLSETNSPPVAEQIVDQQAVLSVLDKVKKNLPLNQKDRDIIDGDNVEPGIRKGKSFNTRWSERKAELGV
jgi:hypothetical protein